MHHCTNVDPYSHEYDTLTSMGKLPHWVASTLRIVGQTTTSSAAHAVVSIIQDILVIAPDKNQPEHSVYL